jgi:hypothetical protein
MTTTKVPLSCYYGATFGLTGVNLVVFCGCDACIVRTIGASYVSSTQVSTPAKPKARDIIWLEEAALSGLFVFMARE